MIHVTFVTLLLCLMSLISPAPELVLLALAVHRRPRPLERWPLLAADVVRGLGLQSLGPQHVLRGVRVGGVEGVILAPMPGSGHPQSHTIMQEDGHSLCHWSISHQYSLSSKLLCPLLRVTIEATGWVCCLLPESWTLGLGLGGSSRDQTARLRCSGLLIGQPGPASASDWLRTPGTSGLQQTAVRLPGQLHPASHSQGAPASNL